MAVIGFFLMTAWKADVTYLVMAFHLAFTGIGLGLTMAPIAAAVINASPAEHRGTSSALVIIFRQIIPQMSSIIIVSVTLGIPGFILGETILSYLGLGIIDPAVSWGSLLNREITNLNNLRHFPWFLVPGLFLLVTTLSFNFLGDLLRDILDPYFREKKK